MRRSFKIQASLKVNFWRDKNTPKKTENSSQPTTSELASLWLYTEELSTSTIVMIIPVNFMRKLINLKAQLNPMRTISGHQPRPTSGFLRKMRKWKNILKKNWEEEKSTLRSNFLRTTEEFLNSMLNLKKLPSSFTTSWLMTPSKSENVPFPIQEEIHSQWQSRDKNCQETSLWINLDRPMLKTLSKLKIWMLVKVSKYMEKYSIFLAVTNSPETTIPLNSEDSCNAKIKTKVEVKISNQVNIILFRHYHPTSQRNRLRGRFSRIHLQIGPQATSETFLQVGRSASPAEVQCCVHFTQTWRC